MIGNLIKLAGTVINGFVKIHNKKQDLKAARLDAEIRMTSDDRNAATDLDILTMRNNGWKDEVLFIIVIAPIVLAFAGFDEVVTRGFDAIDKMPDWYIVLVVLLFVAVYGYRRMLTMILQSKMGKLLTDKIAGG